MGAFATSVSLGQFGNFGPSPNGVLYVPNLNTSDPCANASSPYVPQNVTRAANFPIGGLAKVALAPWLSPECVESYLSSARQDQVQAFIFFLPSQGNTAPPSAADPAWSLNDGGRWKSDNGYPVYAVSTDIGQTLMRELSLYSGNISSAPNASLLTTQFEPHGYVRLVATVNLSLTSGLPSLWIFLVIILAVLILVVGFISTGMHLIQRRRRILLRRRVANGEVDLETLGVKRLMVPKDALDKMPIHTYEKIGPVEAQASETVSQHTLSPQIPSEENLGADVEKVAGASPPQTRATRLNHFEQPTCAICLDDFVPAESRVRQLPCDHIFHPDCVDVFLTQNSSLCPLCKKSALPAGYCPSNITTAMVRRERLIRRARERAERSGIEESDDVLNQRDLRAMVMRSISRGPGTQSQAPIERPLYPDPRRASHTAPQQEESRREWLRRRFDTLVGPAAAPRDPESEQRSLPAWRRALQRAFPAA
ncbi:hypothetical protein ANO11243_096710 [Dothideomycetidae sp. 11243]|nr:hypothetical protein ANO11243_096710 [fungal sp. No.11243]